MKRFADQRCGRRTDGEQGQDHAHGHRGRRAMLCRRNAANALLVDRRSRGGVLSRPAMVRGSGYSDYRRIPAMG